MSTRHSFSISLRAVKECVRREHGLRRGLVSGCEGASLVASRVPFYGGTPVEALAGLIRSGAIMTIKQWWTTLLSGKPHFVIGGHDDPYLLRWFVIPRNPHLNIYVHKFMRSDDDRALHDHPWRFLSVILRGGYIEHTPGGTKLRKAPSIAYRKAEHIHRVELLTEWLDGIGERERPCWTLILTGPKARSWGFWCPKGFVPWEQFVAVTPGGNAVGRGCE